MRRIRREGGGREDERREKEGYSRSRRIEKRGREKEGTR